MKRVISQLDVKIRTPTPEIDSSQQFEPWVSQTPHNPIQAQSQSTFLNDRISRHHSSSSTPILLAVDQIAKGAKMIMHRYTLLGTEVKLLRSANREVSKRRKTKKRHLRKEGRLSFQEGQDIRDDQDVNAQIKQKIRGNGSRARRVKTRARRCGNCGKTGHNARTYAIVFSYTKKK